MPEGPEAHHIADQLHALLHNKYVDNIQIFGKKYKENKVLVSRLNSFNHSIRAMDTAVRFNFVRAHGKLIYMEMELFVKKKSNGFRYLINHLGMTGNWRKDKSRHTLVAIHYTPYTSEVDIDPSDVSTIYFDDFRGFGFFGLVSTAELRQQLAKLGPDILSDKFSLESFKDTLKKKHRGAIGTVLIEQDVVAGIGNYLRADILYTAKLDPRTQVDALTDKQKLTLYKAIVKVAQEAYKKNGTTISTYKDIEMEKGGYIPIVYDQEKDPQGNPVEKFNLNGRTMHWVPAIQKSA